MTIHDRTAVVETTQNWVAIGLGIASLNANILVYLFKMQFLKGRSSEILETLTHGGILPSLFWFS